jgi:hypothetical protein
MKNICTVLAVVLLGFSASAATITNTAGSGSFLWTDTAIWAGGVVPAAGDDVVFGGGGAGQLVTIGSNVNAAVRSLVMRGKQIYVNGNTGSFLNVSGNLTQTNGWLKTRTSSGKVIVGGSLFATGGTLNTLQNNPNAFEIAGDLIAGSAYTFSFTLNNAAAFGSVKVGGTTSLGGSTLTISTYTGSVATTNTLILIQNTSANPVSGTFGNVAFDVTTYNLNGTNYTLRLVDWDGGAVKNDIVLTTVVPEPRMLCLIIN